ncbi:MAG TPA: hypothetical protein EYH42_10125 [Sulfurovum sp.]|uniref:hypothetical protein n=1 Tax=Acinetobacter venetianus TaxID=52133 RepID=UPI001A10CACC|nr:hypothetical protein [Acinetobacter venetianus]MDA0697549.1 hypothetical protein [Pseudomonadota bacterium]HIQ28834.1 hypothetical protein [Sulfurovum sp.]
MNITPTLSKISKEEIYDLLRARYRKTYDEAKQEGVSQNILIFRESIDVIQHYDWWLLNIKNDEVMSKRRFEKMDFNSRNNFLKVISSLQYASGLLPEWYGLEIPAFRKFVQYLMELEVQGGWENHTNVVRWFNQFFQQNKFCLNNSQDSSSIPYEHLAQVYFEISEYLKPKIRTDEMVKETFALSDEEENYFQYFKNTLDRNGQVYIMCLNINLYAPSDDCSNNYTSLFKLLKDKIDAIHQLIDQTENLQSYLLKLEPMQKAGLNLHCILMFNCKHSNFSEDGIIAQLHKKIKNEAGLSAESYTLENWNKHLRDYHHKNAVGLIKKGKSNEQPLYYCWYWVYSYFFSVDQVISLNIDGYNANGYIFKALSNKSLMPQGALLQKDIIKQITFDELLALSKRNKSYDCQHLPQIAQNYLDKVALMDFPCVLFPVSHKDKIPCSSLLYLIELFCETLKTVPAKLFNIVITPATSDKNRSPKFYSDSLTRLGRIWFGLFKNLKNVDYPFFQIGASDFESQNRTDFSSFFFDHKQELLNLNDQPISPETIQKYEELLRRFKTSLNVNTYNKQLKELDKSFEKLSKYADYLLEKDVLVYRLHLKFGHLHGGNFSKKEQSAILTEFLRVGRSTQPLRWLRGYILRWDEKGFDVGQDKTLYADLTLIFNYDSELQSIDIYQSLDLFLKKFIDQRNENYRNSEDLSHTGPLAFIKAEFIYLLKPYAIWDGVIELSSKPLKIETTDKVTRGAFKDKYLPYICYKSLFSPIQGWVPKEKRLTLGQKPKSKHVLVKKNDDEQS